MTPLQSKRVSGRGLHFAHNKCRCHLKRHKRGLLALILPVSLMCYCLLNVIEAFKLLLLMDCVFDFIQDSTGMKLWKKRWFVLSDLCLFYYRGKFLIVRGWPRPSKDDICWTFKIKVLKLSCWYKLKRANLTLNLTCSAEHVWLFHENCIIRQDCVKELSELQCE